MSDITEVKSIPHTPTSQPFIEKVIGNSKARLSYAVHSGLLVWLSIAPCDAVVWFA